MAFAIKATIGNIAPLLGQLDKLSKAVRNRILKKALAAGAKPVWMAARQGLQTQTGRGILRRSLGAVTKAYRKSGTVVAVIGPRTGFKTQIGPKKYEDPARIGHLVELGHVIMPHRKVLAGKAERKALRARGGLGRVPAHPFLAPAFDASRAAAMSIIRETIWNGIAAEATKKAAAAGAVA